MPKLARSALLTFLNAKPSTPETPEWYLIGKDVEDMSISLNPSSETVTNILDESTTTDTGYAPSTDVDTYYADPSDGDFYTLLKDITMNRKTGGDCETQILEVLIDKEEAPYDAWRENVIIKPSSYGGAPGGISIPFNISFNGNREQGTAAIEDRKPTFTKGGQ